MPEDDVAARGRAIFEQLRHDATPAAATAEVDDPAGDGTSPAPAGEPIGAERAAVADQEELVVKPDETEQSAVEEQAAHHHVEANSSPAAGPAATADPTAGLAGDSPVPASLSATVPAVEDTALPAKVIDDVSATTGVPPPPAPPPEADAPAPPAPAPEASATPPEEAEVVRAPPGPVPLGMPPDTTGLLAGSEVTSADPSTYSPTRFARDLPRVMAIANQKGGVGKTTTAVNLGAGLAEQGYRVLVIDLDPQGNATTGLGINPRNLESSIYDVMMHDVPLDDCIEPTSLRNLFVCPATIDLAGAEIELVPAFSRELKLRRALEPVLEDFDFVVIDCPPSLGLITVNALAAATEVVVPIQCEYYALEGLGQLLRNVKLVQTNLNPRLEVSAIVLTMFDARTKLADQVATEVRNHFGPKVCRNIVPRTVRLSEAPSFGQPIVVFDPTSRGAIAYRELAKEVSGGAPQRVG